ncbi:hypothetical protein CO701_22680 [Citrobacter werkmanii]|uniref:O-antigen ligase family protein n=1 Tax=Citrobacter sp. wls711 TaxID=2576425 RepID=UPI000BBCFF4C|nr:MULTISPECIES: O-antigen ligase family protein [Citrobacter]ATF51705.1 hypothetical protein CO701_22680 [Citrobacter werkmanii]TKU54687.1 hypothetical protein FDW98_22290 [Citrobacter sp. wls711]HEE0105828.1 O-antigen ligase family protein [Citrobacter gillenii]HEE0119500.1 O-antigen ligase family protein [Citrobacter gillenii]
MNSSTQAKYPSKGILAYFLLFSFCVLCFVWPIQNSILPTNRNLFIYLSAALTLYFCVRKKYMPIELSRLAKYAIALIIFFLGFTLVNGLFVAADVGKMLRSWQGQYLRAGLLFFVGLFLYPICKYHFKNIKANKILSLVVLCLLGVIFIHLLQNIYFYIKTGTILWGETWIVPSRTEMSFQINMVTGILLAEIACRLFLGRKYLIFSNKLMAAFILLCFICSALAKTRWGTIGLIGSTISICVFIALKAISRKNLPKLCLATLVIAMVVGIVGYTSWHQDSRWKSLSMDMVAGWDLGMHSRCYNGFDGPLMQDSTGRIMDDSNSCRASFFRQGTELIAEYPFGAGPRKDAFLVLLQEKYHDPIIQQSNSHYGLIDVTLQNGVLGLINWLAFVMLMILIGWRAFSRDLIIPGLYLSLFTVSFLFRSGVDNMMRDHYLEQNLALSGLMLGLIFTSNKISRAKK